MSNHVTNNDAMQDSLTPRERQQAQEVNALGLPVTIHLEDQMIPVPASYATAGPGDSTSEGAEGNSLWRSDTDGDLAKWLNNGFTPRAPGTEKSLFAVVDMRLWQLSFLHCMCVSGSNMSLMVQACIVQTKKLSTFAVDTELARSRHA